jgi:hypothetical protein
MKKPSRAIQSFALIALLSPLFLFAETEEGRILVGERSSLPPNANSESEAATIQEESFGDREQNDSWLSYIFDRYPSAYYPASIHWLSAVAAFGDSVELEDGSTWKVSSYDQYKANTWRTQDPLVVTQNHRWFSKYNYRIINTTSGAMIEANLHFGPFKNGKDTPYVSFIDFDEYEVHAINGKGEVTHWDICSKDRQNFDGWDLNDALIIGHNSGWDSRYECILINVNMNNFVRAKQF